MQYSVREYDIGYVIAVRSLPVPVRQVTMTTPTVNQSRPRPHPSSVDRSPSACTLTQSTELVDWLTDSTSCLTVNCQLYIVLPSASHPPHPPPNMCCHLLQPASQTDNHPRTTREATLLGCCCCSEVLHLATLRPVLMAVARTSRQAATGLRLRSTRDQDARSHPHVQLTKNRMTVSSPAD